MKNTVFNLNIISIALFSCLYIGHAIAETADTTQLNSVTVTGSKKKAQRKDNEITGLGKLVKNSDVLSKEQILNIRDLTRYDPGISVVEQGRGASSGYSIRGVDQNRVALLVDGLPQIQAYKIQKNWIGAESSGGSGAINEIEYENIRSVEISKGASSAEYGSGSLGGAVAFTTKEAKDIIKSGKSWGLQTKNAYSGKNHQLTNSLAFAGESNGIDAMIIYTHRSGKELQVHKDAGNYNHTTERVSGHISEYNLSSVIPNTKSTNGWFIIDGECNSPSQCDPKQLSVITRPTLPTRRTIPNYSPEEEADYLAHKHKTEVVNGNEYTGKDRIKPNPMDYSTDSWLARLGYQFTSKHYLGAIFEHTKQKYDIQDMSVPKYILDEELDNQAANQISSKGTYSGNNFLDGVFIRPDNRSNSHIGVRWARARFIDEEHTKVRKGILYRYNNEAKDSPIDHAELTFDNQKIEIDNFFHLNHCSEYPTVDKNCRVSLDKPFSYYQSERNIYEEDHKLVKLNLDKETKLGFTTHRINLLTGLDHFSSSLKIRDYFEENVVYNREFIDGKGTFNSPYRYSKGKASLVTLDHCVDNIYNCTTRNIDGSNYFLALRDHVSLGKYFEVGGGLRYDYHKMKSDDKWTGTGTYKTTSWNIGLVAKPTQYMSLSYRASTGFRVPSFYEQFGYRNSSLDKQYVSKLSPEKAFNQEIGINFRGNFGTLETSYFYNTYKDMIILAKTKESQNPSEFDYGYHNAQDITISGINLIGKIDWNGVYDEIPEGLYTSLAYNRIKPKKVKTRSSLTFIQSPLLDSLQPSRYVIGLGYDDPEGTWGANAVMTYSKGKSNAELLGTAQYEGANYESNATKKRTRHWRIYDLVGYYNVKDFLTLRAGIYNLFNTRYVTWESVRQSSVNSQHSQKGVTNYSRYAAPGRNYTLSLELKF